MLQPSEGVGNVCRLASRRRRRHTASAMSPTPRSGSPPIARWNPSAPTRSSTIPTHAASAARADRRSSKHCPLVRADQLGRSSSAPRVMDDIVLRLVRAGAKTVLNLAAGLDARPYRLDLPADLRWLHVDMPEMVDYFRTGMAGETPKCRLRIHSRRPARRRHAPRGVHEGRRRRPGVRDHRRPADLPGSRATSPHSRATCTTSRMRAGG